MLDNDQLSDLAHRQRAPAQPDTSQQPIDVALAVQAERERVVSLLALQQPGFEKEITAAIRDGASVADTAVRILAIQADRGITLRAIQADSKGAQFVPAPDFQSRARPDGADEIFKRRADAIKGKS